MKRYPIRAIKYAIYLAVLLSVLILIVSVLDRNSQSWIEIMKSSRGTLLLAAFAFLALIHPFIAYIIKPLVIDVNQREEDIDKVMKMCGYVKISSNREEKIYRAKSFVKKLNLVFEDAVSITTKGDMSEISGPRKEVTRIIFRLDTFVNQTEQQ